MGKVLDLDGFKIHRIEVIERDFSRGVGKGRYWKYKCICGNVSTGTAADIHSGTIHSCGCSRKNNPKVGNHSIRGTYAQMGRGPSPILGRKFPGRKPTRAKGTWNHTAETKKLQSAIKKKQILEGKISPGGYKAQNKTIHTLKGGKILCHSSWEQNGVDFEIVSEDTIKKLNGGKMPVSFREQERIAKLS